MTVHLTDGQLRAALDSELDVRAVAHLGTCPDCQARQRALRTHQSGLDSRLGFLAPAADDPAPSPHAAWSRLSQRLSAPKENPMFKRLFANPVLAVGLAAVLLLALILAIPSTRAVAGQLLQLFRIQQVTVIPVDYTGLRQLTGNDALGSQMSELISSSTTVFQKPADPVPAADAAEAGSLAGFPVRLPANANPSQLYVLGSGSFSLTVDRDKAQALLDEAGRSDLVLPKSIDGQEVSVSIPASVAAGYGTCPVLGADKAEEEMIPGRRYPDCVILSQIPSPTVNAPPDLDVEALAQLGLEFTGMTREEAVAFASTVDWTSTLVIPIPKNAAMYEQVQVDGVTGTLVQRPAGDAAQFALMWVKDGIIYTVSGLGTNAQRAIEMANAMP